MKKTYIIQTSNEFNKEIITLINETYKNENIEINGVNLTIKAEEEKIDHLAQAIRLLIRNIDGKSELIEEVKPSLFRKILFLQGLDCANCAAKIERIAKRTLNNENVTVDFATARLIIESSSEDQKKTLVKDVQAIANSVDSNILVTDKAQTNEEKVSFIKFSKLEIWLFFFGMILFFAGVTFKHILPSFGINLPEYIIFITYILAYTFLGRDVLYKALKNILSGHFFDENFLMSLATIVAIFIQYYEEAISVMLFYKFGELIQNHVVNKSRKSIATLLDIRPKVANLIVKNEVIEVNPLEVVASDIILVRVGERVPVDGVIIEGEASLDVSALTGEVKYREVGIGDEVISGSISTNGAIKIKVEKIYEESMISQILHLVENASTLKAKTEKFITKFAKYYTPIIVVLALLLAISPLIFTNLDFRSSIYSATIFLVVSCPCALVISVPLGFFGGIGGASRKGILIKGSNYLEILANLESIVFDKTGTLTKGTFQVSEIKPINISKEELLELAAYCEVGSNHPIAKSIIKEYGASKINNKRVKVIPAVTKSGSQVILDDKEIAIGNLTFMDKMKIKVPEIDSSGVILYVIRERKYVGYLVLKDEIRPEAKEVITTLAQKGLKVAMFTGDKEIEASEVAEAVGIKAVYAGMSPVDKVKKLRQLKKDLQHGYQAFVGDGINDAPVLGSADVGIAMGGLGSDAAIKVADVVLMEDDLNRIPTAIRIAKKTKKIIYQNITLALVVKIIVILLAIFTEFLPFLKGINNYLMLEAIFADVGVSLIAVLNSLRAANVK